MTDKIYEFRYTYCIYESAMASISLHRTKRGAYKAMNKFLNERFTEKRNEIYLYGKPSKYQQQLYDHIFYGERADVFEKEVKE